MTPSSPPRGRSISNGTAPAAPLPFRQGGGPQVVRTEPARLPRLPLGALRPQQGPWGLHRPRQVQAGQLKQSSTLVCATASVPSATTCSPLYWHTQKGCHLRPLHPRHVCHSKNFSFFGCSSGFVRNTPSSLHCRMRSKNNQLRLLRHRWFQSSHQPKNKSVHRRRAVSEFKMDASQTSSRVVICTVSDTKSS